MTSPCLTAGGLRFLGHRLPAADLGLSSEDGRAYWPRGQTATGLPCSALVRRDGVGCLLYCGALVSAAAAGAACRPLARSSPWLSTIVFRRPSMTQPQQRFTRVHPSRLSLARFLRMVRSLLGLHLPAFARFVTWRLRRSGTGLDTRQGHGDSVMTTHRVRLHVATSPQNRTGTFQRIRLKHRTTLQRRSAVAPSGEQPERYYGRAGSRGEDRWWQQHQLRPLRPCRHFCITA